MNWSVRGWLTAFALAAAVVGGGCSQDSGPKITGTWESEDIRIDSLVVSIGPRLEISQTEVFMPGLETRLPIVAIERPSRNEVYLKFPILGWAVYFDTDDRIHMDVPLMGRVYYRRVAQSVNPSQSSPPATNSTNTHSGNLSQSKRSATTDEQSTNLNGTKSHSVRNESGSDNGRTVTLQLVQDAMTRGDFDTADTLISTAHFAGVSDSEILIERFCLSLMRGNPDAALRGLNEALQSGLIKWPAVEREMRLSSLAQDVRYQALLARYR